MTFHPKHSSAKCVITTAALTNSECQHASPRHNSFTSEGTAHMREALPPDLSATLKVLGWRTWCCCSGISMCSFSICIIFSSKSAMRSSFPPPCHLRS